MLCVLILSSCESPKDTSLTINFTHTVDGVSLVLGQGCLSGNECLPDHSCCTDGDLLPYVTANGEHYNIGRLNYLISNVFLHLGNGTEIPLKGVHFVDAENSSTLTFSYSDPLANNTYSHISFTMGLDSSINNSNTYVEESWDPTMEWPDPMGGGYHYMKLEGDFDTITQGYATHTGPTMGMDHSFDLSFPLNLEVTDNLGNVCLDINMEINNWYQNPHNINLAAGIMMDMPKQMQLQSNGSMDVFSVNVRK